MAEEHTYELRALNQMCLEKVRETDKDINMTSSNENGVALATDNTLYLYSNGTVKKLYSSDQSIICVKFLGEIIFIGFNTGEFLSISTTKTIISRGVA